MIHPRTRQIQLAEMAVAELLLANEAADEYTAARRIRNAIQTAQDYAAISGSTNGGTNATNIH